jgi:hypothetical protein
METSPAPLIVLFIVLCRYYLLGGLSGSTMQRIALPVTTDQICNSFSLKSPTANCFASHASAILQHGCDKTTRRANHPNLSSPLTKNISLNMEGKSPAYLVGLTR